MDNVSVIDRPSQPHPATTAADVFLSYPHADRQAAHAFAGLLRQSGLVVWLDATHIEAFDRIDDRVAEGIAGSRVLVAWYSLNYAMSRACQWELAAAWSNGDGARVLAVNPEPGDAHLVPRKLLDRLLPGGAAGDAMAAAASAVKAVVERTSLPIGDGRSPSLRQPVHYGRQLAGSSRFVGRNATLWALHDALTRASNPMLSGKARSIVQLRGFGGVGKSILAEEYALRFGPAWPGGICWLDAHGHAASSDAGSALEERSIAERDRQFAAIASAFGVSIEGRTPAAIRAALGQAMSVGPRCLWIVDDLPAGLSGEAVNGWLSPQAGVPTLFTTRDRSHGSLGVAIDVDVLAPAESLALFRLHRPVDGADLAAACRLLDTLGHHALAVEVAAAFLGAQPGESIEGFLDDLRDPGEDVLELAGELSDALPLGHSPSIVATLDGTMRRLDADARDLLCLAACVDSAPMPVPLLDAVLASGTAADRSPRARRLLAMNALDRYGLGRPVADPPGALSVHALVVRTALRDRSTAQRLDPVRAAAVAHLTPVVAALFSPAAVVRHALDIAHARALCAVPADAAQALLLARIAGTDLQRGDLAGGEAQARRVLAFAAAAAAAAADARGSAEVRADVVGEVAALARCLLAMCGIVRGEAAAAVQDLTPVLAWFMQQRPAGDCDRAGAMAALGWALAIEGDGTEGRRLCEAALAECAAARGPADDLTLNIQSLLARLLQFEGDVAGGQSMQQQVTALRAQRAGADGSDALDGVTDALMLAQSMLASGDAATAAPMLAKVADTCARTLGPDNLLTLSAQLSGLLADAFHGDAADIRTRAAALSARLAPLFDTERAAGVALDAPGIAHSPVALADLGVAIAERNVPVLLRWTLVVAGGLARQLGSRHPAVLAHRVAAAQLACVEDDWPAAREILDEVVPLASAVLGDGHPCSVDAMLCLAACLSAQGDLAAAGPLLATAVAAREAIAGPADPRALDARLALNERLRDLGEHGQCAEDALALLPSCERVFGADSPQAVALRIRMVGCLVTVCGPEGSAEAWAAADARADGVLRRDDPVRLMMKTSHAHVLLGRQDFSGCRRLMEDALLPWDAGAAPGTPLDAGLRNAITALALALHSLGEWQQSAAQWQRLYDAADAGAEGDRLNLAEFLYVARRQLGDVRACRELYERDFAPFCQPGAGALTPQQERIRSAIAVDLERRLC